jgi:hypothetical protein
VLVGTCVQLAVWWWTTCPSPLRSAFASVLSGKSVCTSMNLGLHVTLSISLPVRHVLYSIISSVSPRLKHLTGSTYASLLPQKVLR